MRSVRPALGIVVILLACGMLLNRFYEDPSFLPPDDFLQYWAAGRLNTSGGNPYDADQLLELQRSAGRPVDRPAVMMWNPPWVLTLAMPFGQFPPRTAQLVWLLLQVGVVVFAADRIWIRLGGEPRSRPFVWAGSLIFFPVMYIVFAGQSSGWLLLGLVGLLANGRREWMIPFLAVKPHLFVPIWIVLLLDSSVSRTSRRMLLIGIAVGLVCAVVPFLVNVEVWQQYLAAINRPGDAAHSPLSGWRSPLIGYWVRAAIAPEAFVIQAIPTILLAIATPIYWWTRRSGWEWHRELPILVLAGLIASPYGAWPYDQIVLLFPVLAGVVRLLRVGCRQQILGGAIVLALINAIALTIRTGEYFVWVPPAIALWFAWAACLKPRVTPHSHSCPASVVGVHA